MGSVDLDRMSMGSVDDLDRMSMGSVDLDTVSMRSFHLDMLQMGSFDLEMVSMGNFDWDLVSIAICRSTGFDLVSMGELTTNTKDTVQGSHVIERILSSRDGQT